MQKLFPRKKKRRSFASVSDAWETRVHANAGKGELRYCQLATVGTEADAPVQLTLVWAGDSVDSAGDASDAAPQSKWRQSGSAETTASAPAAAAADPATRAMRDRHPRLSKLADALWTRANGAPGEPGADPRNLNPNSTPLLHSVWGNLHSAPGNAVVGRDGDAAWALLHGERWHWEAFAGADVAFRRAAPRHAAPRHASLLHRLTLRERVRERISHVSRLSAVSAPFFPQPRGVSAGQLRRLRRPLTPRGGGGANRVAGRRALRGERRHRRVCFETETLLSHLSCSVILRFSRDF